MTDNGFPVSAASLDNRPVHLSESPTTSHATTTQRRRLEVTRRPRDSQYSFRRRAHHVTRITMHRARNPPSTTLTCRKQHHRGIRMYQTRDAAVERTKDFRPVSPTNDQSHCSETIRQRTHPQVPMPTAYSSSSVGPDIQMRPVT